MRTRADGSGGIGQGQPAGEVGRGRFAQRLSHHRGGFGAVVAQQFAEGDLDGEDHQLNDFDWVLAGFVGVVDGVVEDQFEDRVAALVLDQGVDPVDPLGEDVIAQVQALAHLAVLRAEARQHPDRTVGHWAVRAVDQWALLALGERAQSLDGLVVVMGHDHRAGTAVVAARQRAADGLQRGCPAFRAVDPVRQFGGRRPLSGGQETRNCQWHNGNVRLVDLGRGQFLARDLQQTKRFVGQSGQLWLVTGAVDRHIAVTGTVAVTGAITVIVDELAVLVHPHAADVHRIGRRQRRVGTLRFRLGFRLEQILGQHLAEHQVRVGAAETEPGHPRDGVSAVAGPFGDGVGDFQMYAVEVDVRVGSGVVDRRRNSVVAQRQGDLGQAGRTRRRLQVAQVGLHRS